MEFKAVVGLHALNSNGRSLVTKPSLFLFMGRNFGKNARQVSTVLQNRSKDRKTGGVRILKSNTFNPFFNLATEDWLFRSSDPEKHTLFLWRNKPTVVIGRHQNPYSECRLSAMEKDNVELARRHSGGGAVYQDLGNTNFTLISGVHLFDKERNFSIITRALSACGIKDPKQTGRNDIAVDGMKVSGSAFRTSNKLAFHHGTLLVNVDLNAMSKYLTPSSSKLKSKGVKSVKSRVANLKSLTKKQLNHSLICSAIADEFCSEHGANVSAETLATSILQKEKTLLKEYQVLSDWNWRFGTTPQFEWNVENYFDWGLVNVHIDTDKGMIRKGRVYSDSLNVDSIDALNHALEHSNNLPFNQKGIVDLKDSALKWLVSHGKGVEGTVIDDVIGLIHNQC